ncbi:hypothetical protein WJX74_008365 [Apatococcus lobatus]|uniref:Uncharacterized protein n=1 Tax=Apatococcus lobatus TaxID=904363 RepID=A0AAW1RX53_9CHLO
MAATDFAALKDLVAWVCGNDVSEDLEVEDFRRLQDGKFTSKLRLESATAESLIASGLDRAIVDVIVSRTSGAGGSAQGSLSGGLPGTALDPDHSMSLFLAWLGSTEGNMAIKKVVILSPQQQASESRPAEKVLHFPTGMHLLGFPEAFPTQSVFMRKCYANLHAIMDYYSAGGGSVRIWYFTGTPGIDSKTHAAPVLVFASPKKRFREPTKLPQNCKVLIVPPFSQDELLEMQRLMPSDFALSEKRIFQLFPLTGGSLRHLLSSTSYGAYLGKLQNAFADLEVGKMKALLLSANLFRTDDVSDKIFHMVPLEHAISPRETSPVKPPQLRYYLEGSIKIATEMVHALLVQRLYLGSSLRAQLNIVTQEHLLETAAANGYHLESLGGELKCRWLDSQKDFTMQLKAAKPASFHSAAQLMKVAQVDGSIYALPNSTTYPAVDSAVTPCIHLQSAKASSHTLQVDALEILRQALGSSGKQESAFKAAASLTHPPRVFKKPLVVMVTTPAHFDDSYKELQRSKGAQPKRVTSVMQAVATIPIEDWGAAHLVPPLDTVEHSVEGSSGTAHIVNQDQDGGALTSEPHFSEMETDHGLPVETHQASTSWSGSKRQHRSDQL